MGTWRAQDLRFGCCARQPSAYPSSGVSLNIGGRLQSGAMLEEKPTEIVRRAVKGMLEEKPTIPDRADFDPNYDPSAPIECERCGGEMFYVGGCKILCANCGYRRDCSDP